ncbi:MAG: hypothetical protein D6739_08605, partial [Nitrospirae bacterium]
MRRLPVLETAGEAAALMWRHLTPAVLLTLVPVLPLEWAVDAAGLRAAPDRAPAAFALATLLSVAGDAWATAAYLRLVAAREQGDRLPWGRALFEALD